MSKNSSSVEDLYKEIYELAFDKLRPFSMRLTDKQKAKLDGLIEQADDLFDDIRFPDTSELMHVQVQSRLLEIKRKVSKLLESIIK